MEHGPDFTWSFIVPWQLPFSRQRPLDSYEAIHRALAEALGKTGIDVTLAGKDIPAPAGGMCFAAPAPADLLLAGRKICGAGQRRCRHGLLHQGSICGVPLPDDFPMLLASRLAKNVRTYAAGRLPFHAAGELVRLRYGTESWLRRR